MNPHSNINLNLIYIWPSQLIFSIIISWRFTKKIDKYLLLPLNYKIKIPFFIIFFWIFGYLEFWTESITSNFRKDLWKYWHIWSSTALRFLHKFFWEKLRNKIFKYSNTKGLSSKPKFFNFSIAIYFFRYREKLLIKKQFIILSNTPLIKIPNNNKNSSTFMKFHIFRLKFQYIRSVIKHSDHLN